MANGTTNGGKGPVKWWLADLAFAALQQTGVAGALFTIWLLSDKIGADKAILVGLIVGLIAALSAATARQRIASHTPPDRGEQQHRAGGGSGVREQR